MTMDGKFMKQPFVIADSSKKQKLSRDALIPMGITSENVAKKFGITRMDQDQLSVQSHARAASAKNKFQEEIVPVKTIMKDSKTNKPKTIVIKHDDGYYSFFINNLKTILQFTFLLQTTLIKCTVG